MFPVRTPVEAAIIQELNLKYLKFIDSFIFEGKVVGRNKPIIRLITRPVRKLKVHFLQIVEELSLLPMWPEVFLVDFHKAFL